MTPEEEEAKILENVRVLRSRSLRICHLKEGAYCGSRAGFLFRLINDSRIWVITAGHDWIGEQAGILDCDENNLKGLFPLPPFTIFYDTETDCAFTEVQFKNWDNEAVQKFHDLFSVYQNNEELPITNENFGFWSYRPLAESHPALSDKTYLEFDDVYSLDMIIKEIRADFIIFNPTMKHMGNIYKGASGTPIFNEDGFIIAILTGGCQEKMEIYSCCLSKIIHLIKANS